MSELPIIEAAKRARIRYPFLADLSDDEVGGLRAYLLVCQQIEDRTLDNGETVGQAITRWLHTAMVEHPGLIDALPSPDHALRRLRDVNKKQKDNPEQVQPGLF